ncbi:hypothetical protein [Sorangium sp. So ce233]|uniref:hypothetical protein n=1 Tax=Sorangium sp. So ce233 TaxID=3133290 RepID=UPI003F63C596
MTQPPRSPKPPAPLSYPDPPPSGIAIQVRRAGDPAVQRLASEAAALGLVVVAAEETT